LHIFHISSFKIELSQHSTPAVTLPPVLIVL
jgi:hypothetical protein